MIGASLKLTGSLSVITQIAVLLEEHGFSDAIDGGQPPASGLAVAPTVMTPAPTPLNAPVPQPVITPAAPAAAVELDASGLPWDERIHSGNKQKKGDQTWMKRKNLAPGVFEQVQAELRAQYPNVPNAGAVSAPTALPVAAAAPVAEPVPMVMAPQPVAPVMPPMQVPVPQPEAPVPMAVMAPQPVAAPVPATTPPMAGPPTNLHELMNALTPLTDPSQGGRITPDYLMQCLAETTQAYGQHLNGSALTNLADIAGFPTLPLAGYIWQLFQRDGHVA